MGYVKMKRCLCCLVAVILMFTSVPLEAFAEDAYMAWIGEYATDTTTYQTIKAALEAAQAGDIVYQNKTVDTSATEQYADEISVKADVTYVIGEGKTVKTVTDSVIRLEDTKGFKVVSGTLQLTSGLQWRQASNNYAFKGESGTVEISVENGAVTKLKNVSEEAAEIYLQPVAYTVVGGGELSVDMPMASSSVSKIVMNDNSEITQMLNEKESFSKPNTRSGVTSTSKAKTTLSKTDTGFAVNMPTEGMSITLAGVTYTATEDTKDFTIYADAMVEDVFYLAFDAALSAVESGETVKVTAYCTESAEIVVPDGIILQSADGQTAVTGDGEIKVTITSGVITVSQPATPPTDMYLAWIGEYATDTTTYQTIKAALEAAQAGDIVYQNKTVDTSATEQYADEISVKADVTYVIDSSKSVKMVTDSVIMVDTKGFKPINGTLQLANVLWRQSTSPVNNYQVGSNDGMIEVVFENGVVSSVKNISGKVAVVYLQPVNYTVKSDGIFSADAPMISDSVSKMVMNHNAAITQMLNKTESFSKPNTYKDGITSNSSEKTTLEKTETGYLINMPTVGMSITLAGVTYTTTEEIKDFDVLAAAFIEDIRYLTMQGALSAAESGETIQLVADGRKTTALSVPAGVSVVSYDNSRTITGAADGSTLVDVENGVVSIAVYQQTEKDNEDFETYRALIAEQASAMHQQDEAYSALAIICAGEKEIAAYQNNRYMSLEQNKAALDEILAELKNNMGALYPENGLLGATGETSRQQEHLEWKEKYSAEAKVNRILKNNYVFIADGDKAWKIDQVIDLVDHCYITEKYEFYISADAADKVLGLTIEGDYINVESVASQLQLDLFLDPRGVVVMGNNVVYDGAYDKNFEDGIVKTGYSSNVEGYADFYAIADVIGRILWEDIEPTDADYQKYISNWQKALTVEDISDPKNANYIATTISEAKRVQSTISLGDNAAGPFAEYQIGTQEVSSASLSQTFYECFQQLEIMAKGYYVMPEGIEKDQLARDIKAVLEYIYPHFTEKIRYTVTDSGKWTNYEFNIPFCFANVMALVYDELTPEELGKYTNAVFDRDPDSAAIRGSSNGSRNITNRSWVSFAYLNNAILAKDTRRINHALKYMTEGYIYAINNYTQLEMPKGGIFEDGSVVFHKSYAYTMGYGAQHIENISGMIILSSGTVFDVRNVPFFENIYEMIINNYLPFYADDVKMKIVSGRWGAEDANKTIVPMMAVANHAPEAAREELTKAILDTISGYESNYQTTSRTGRAVDYTAYVEEIKDFWNFVDTLSYEAKEERYNRVYPSMDRVLHKFGEITVGIGMTSSRISSFEANASAGQMDWYVNEGSVYVYNGDQKQFNEQWFLKANMTYIPGTTVEDIAKDPVIRGSGDQNLSDVDWAGGVSDGTHGLATMQLGKNFDYDLDGYKTFFMLDDRIVCLGSGIYGGTNALRTVIDNRWIDKSAEDADDNSKIAIVGAIVEGDSNNRDAATIASMFNGSLGDGCALSDDSVKITFELDKTVDIGGITIAFNKGNVRKAVFDVQISVDGITYTDVATGVMSSGSTLGYEFYDISGTAKYVRIIGHGSRLNKDDSYNKWFWINEINVYDSTVDKDKLVASFDNPDMGYELIKVDGEGIDTVFNAPTVFDASSVYLEGFGGYVLLDESSVTINREYLNSQTFAEVYINHGIAASEDTAIGYAYVMLPGRSDLEVSAYAGAPDVSVIENTSDHQMLQDNVTGIIAGSMYSVGEVSGFIFNTPCAFMLNLSEGKMYVSDPTHKLDNISITIPDEYSVTTVEHVASNGNVVTVDTSLYTGETFTIDLVCKHSVLSDWMKNDEKHWKKCDNCGEEFELENHDFQWIVDKEASETENGLMHEECKVCEYQGELMTISKKGSNVSTSPERESEANNANAGTTNARDESYAKTESANAPLTGDGAKMGFWIGSMLLGLLGIASVILQRKKYC